MTKTPNYRGVAKVFRSGRSQAVRLPAACRFETSEVETIKEGDCVTLRPRGKNWATYFDSESRILWACQHLKSIDALDNSRRGVWSITRKGLDYLEMDRVEEALKSAAKAVARERKKARAESQSEPVDDDEELAEGDDDGGEDWKGRLLGALKAMEPGAFERLSMQLVKEAEFRNVEVLGKSGDGGDRRCRSLQGVPREFPHVFSVQALCGKR